MEIYKLITRLKHDNITLEANDGKLSVYGEPELLTGELLQEIRSNKSELLEFLSEHQKGGSGQSYLSQDIDAIEDQMHYPMSHAQYRIWVLDQMEENQISYNMQVVHDIEMQLDYQMLVKSLQYLVSRHDSLRTIFVSVKGDPRQLVVEKNKAIIDIDLIHIEDADRTSNEEIDRQLVDIITKDRHTPFDLHHGPLIRMRLVRIGNRSDTLILNMHHIISDGWSMGVIHNELADHIFKNQRKEPLRIQYKDYTVWQRLLTSSGKLDQSSEYWCSKFEGEIPALNIPTDFPRPPIFDSSGDTRSIRLSADIRRALRRMSDDESCSLFITLITSLKTLLHIYSGQSDTVVGTPVSGREHYDLDSQVGFYINTLPLRTKFSSSDSFKDLLKQIKQETHLSYDHQFYPIDILVNELSIKRDMSRSTLFDVLVDVVELDETAGKGDSLQIDYNDDESDTAKVDLSFGFAEYPDGMMVTINYSKGIFKQDRIDRMLKHYQRLFASIAANPYLSIDELEYLPDEEKHILLEGFNSSGRQLVEEDVVLAFQRQVRKTPDAVAVVLNNQNFSYSFLDACANRLLNFLKENYQIGVNDVIALMLPRDERWVITSLTPI